MAARHLPSRRRRVTFLSGLIAGAAAFRSLVDVPAAALAITASPLQLALAGLAVGAGTRAGGGCTSGHGICGLARFSLRSAVAVGALARPKSRKTWRVDAR